MTQLLRTALATLVLVSMQGMGAHAQANTDPHRDILVTFDNTGARMTSAGAGAPYQQRKRYAISRTAKRHSAAIMVEHRLVEIEHWPIRSLSVYCFVYRVPEGVDRADVITALQADSRVESVQALQRFDTGIGAAVNYDDTYANLQYGLEMLDVTAAHRSALGSGVRVAIVDSQADREHEDLKGRIRRVHDFVPRQSPADIEHGTAVASVIGARSNNARGMVGVAPEAQLEIYVACWGDGADGPAICDSFSLLKALDAMLEDPPQVLNLSLVGPHDPLLERVLDRALDGGVVVVAAGPSANGASGAGRGSATPSRRCRELPP